MGARAWSTFIVILCLGGLAAALSGYLLVGPRPAPETPKLPSARSAVISTRLARESEAGKLENLDPLKDGWESEEFAERAGERLKSLVGLLERPDDLAPEKLATFLAPDFSCGGLRPDDLTTVREDDAVLVRRPSGGSPAPTGAAHRGPGGLAASLRSLIEAPSGVSRVETHVKVIRVDVGAGEASTEADVEVVVKTASRIVQQNATWECRWMLPRQEAPQLASILVGDFEEVVSPVPRAWFSDCTGAVLGEDSSYRDQLAFGLNHWLSRIERVYDLHAFVRNGIAVGDVNGDGLDDVYICQPGGLPNRLYVQDPDGTAEDRSRSAGVDVLEHTASALLVDLDGDGDQDLVLATKLGLVLMENDASGGFRRRAILPTERAVQSISAVDHDVDGDLDLYVCVDIGDHELSAERPSFVYHDANDGGANCLFRNDISAGDPAGWRFTNVTEAVGLDEHNRRHSLAAAWEDYDDDGDQDLYVANDYGQNCLYRNDGGHFVDVAAPAGVVDYGSGMSVSWADYNRDGRMDLYVGNMFSSAGNRITSQRQFRALEREELRDIYQRFAKGNSLFENAGDGTFREVSREAAVEIARWAWSSVFVDIDNDGWEDVFVANGYITGDGKDDL